MNNILTDLHRHCHCKRRGDSRTT